MGNRYTADKARREAAAKIEAAEVKKGESNTTFPARPVVSSDPLVQTGLPHEIRKEEMKSADPHGPVNTTETMWGKTLEVPESVHPGYVAHPEADEPKVKAEKKPILFKIKILKEGVFFEGKGKTFDVESVDKHGNLLLADGQLISGKGEGDLWTKLDK